MNRTMVSVCVAILGLAGCSTKEKKAEPAEDPNPTESTNALGPGRCVQLNAAGQILGVGLDHEPFLIDPDRTRTPLGTFENQTTVGLTIDEDGTVYGYSDSLDGRVAVRYRNGVWEEIEGWGSAGAALALDGREELAGYQVIGGGTRGFWIRNGVSRSLPLPQDRFSAIYGIRGERAVGVFEEADQQTHAFVIDGEVLTDLGTLGGDNSTALGLNAQGDVVGASETSDGTVRAFVRWAGTTQLVDLGLVAGAVAGDARGIDDSGRILVNAQFPDGHSESTVFFSDGTSADLGLTHESIRYASVHGAAVSPDGIAVGWGVPEDTGEEPLHCLRWDLNQVAKP